MPDTASVLAPSFVRALPSSSRPLAELIDRLRTPAERGLAFALHETTSAARPYLLAGIHGAIGGTMLVVVPTADVAERTFADLTYYLSDTDARTVSLVRARDEAVGALDSPSERSARMTLLADLCANKPQIVVVPVAALRQYVMPCATFRAETQTLRADDEPGFDTLQQTLYRLGYDRVDVVSAAGEFAVRGGIIDVFPATAEQPVRLEFFGDTLESLRPFEIQSQRSEDTIASVTIVPWLEVLRDDALRANVLARATGESNVISAVRAFLAQGNDVPEPWIGYAYDERTTLLDYGSTRMRS